MLLLLVVVVVVVGLGLGLCDRITVDAFSLSFCTSHILNVIYHYLFFCLMIFYLLLNFSVPQYLSKTIARALYLSLLSTLSLSLSHIIYFVAE